MQCIINSNCSPKWQWLVVDVFQAVNLVDSETVRWLSSKIMIFKHTSCCQWLQFFHTNDWSYTCHVVLLTSFSRHFLALVGTKKGDVNHSCIWDNSVQKAIKNLVLGLFMNKSCQLNKVTQDLTCVCKQKTFLPVSLINYDVKRPKLYL